MQIPEMEATAGNIPQFGIPVNQHRVMKDASRGRFVLYMQIKAATDCTDFTDQNIY
jgi:hypothetical protein